MEAMDPAEGGAAFQVLVLIRGLHFAAVFVLFGAAFFWTYVRGDLPKTRRATERLLRGAALASALFGLFWLAILFANMAGGYERLADSEMLAAFFFQTQFGPAILVRLALLGATVAAALTPMRNEARCWVLGAIGAALLVDQAWLGHAAEGVGLWGALMIAVYSVHTLSAAAWVGGLPPLLFGLRESRSLPGQAARETAVAVLASFSVMAVLAVAAIMVTGVANASFHHGLALGRPFSTDYVGVHVMKVFLVMAMLVCAAFNRLVATPGLRAGYERMPAQLRLSVSVELAIGVLVVAAAALLGVTPPPY